MDSLALLLVLTQVTAIAAQQELQAIAPQQVQVAGRISDTDARREFVAGKIIIGRKRIEDSGARKVDELLRKEPAVTVSSDGRIGLLDMPGYTQIFIDGKQPIARSPGDLDLVHVEKIEIIKSSMAEYGPFGIAGTINVITRKTSSKTETELTSGLTSTGGKPGVTLALSHNRSMHGSSFRSSFQLSAEQSTTADASRHELATIISGSPEEPEWKSVARGQARSGSVAASADLTWQRAAGETLSLSPQLSSSPASTGHDDARTWNDGSLLQTREWSRSRIDSLSVPVRWIFKPASKSQVELYASRVAVNSKFSVDGSDAENALPAVEKNRIKETRANSSTLDFSYKEKFATGHNVKVGASFRSIGMDYDYRYRFSGETAVAFDALGARSSSRHREMQMFAQDELRLNDRLAVQAGFAALHAVIDMDEKLYRGRHRYHVLSPSLHLARKVSADNKRQIRFSISRSFKGPQENDLTSHPEINPLAPCRTNTACGPNTIESADRAGNTALRPERALGLNISYEHGIGEDSQIKFEVFSRHIDDKIGKEIIFDNVPWSDTPRYVIRPTNFGRAHSAGINVEMDLALRDLASNSPNLVVRGSSGFASSRVSSLPGPYNRLDQQAPWHAKLGATYEVQRLPVTIDIDASWKPAVWIQTMQSERRSLPRRFTVEMNGKWALNRGGRVILSWTTSLPREAHSVNDYIAGGIRTRISAYEDRNATVQIQYETSL